MKSAPTMMFRVTTLLRTLLQALYFFLPRNIDKIVKAIAFIVAIAIIVLTLGVAAVLIILDDIFTIVAIGVVICGTILALIFLFLIYALGHIITQNKKILRKL